VALSGVALLVIAGVPWPPAISWALGGAVILLALLAARRWAPPLDTLRIDFDGKISGRPVGNNQFLALALLPAATVHPWLTVLRLVGEGREYRMLIAGDSAPPDAFRRLRVWLRWRADFANGAGDS
jgi:toxin CptA